MPLQYDEYSGSNGRSSVDMDIPVPLGFRGREATFLLACLTTSLLSLPPAHSPCSTDFAPLTWTWETCTFFEDFALAIPSDGHTLPPYSFIYPSVLLDIYIPVWPLQNVLYTQENGMPYSHYALLLLSFSSYLLPPSEMLFNFLIVNVFFLHQWILRIFILYHPIVLS